MEISVVVCTYNRLTTLKKCLESLVVQSLNKDKFEVLVIDNNSTDNTRLYLEEFCKTHNNFAVLIEKNAGVSYARNKGIYNSKGKYIAFIDDDAIATENWLEKILYDFENVNPKPSVVGGKILPYYISSKPTWFKDEFEIRTWGNKPNFLTGKKTKYGFSGSNMILNKELLISNGGFNPDYGPKGKKYSQGEEAELFFRLNLGENSLWFNPNIIVYHLVKNERINRFYKLNKLIESLIVSFRLKKDTIINKFKLY